MHRLYHLTRKSANKKTGKIPVTTSPESTCPPTCPFREFGCYGKYGPLALHWCKVSTGERGVPWSEFVELIRALPDGTMWRHNQVGDLPGEGLYIDIPMLCDLVRANEDKNGFTYTHKPLQDSDLNEPAPWWLTESNRNLVKYANDNGFTVNLSANNLSHADELAALNCGPVVTVLPTEQTENTVTPGGLKVVICPAVTRDDVSCSTCGLCARADRKVVVGFPAHGAARKAASKVASPLAWAEKRRLPVTK